MKPHPLIIILLAVTTAFCEPPTPAHVKDSPSGLERGRNKANEEASMLDADIAAAKAQLTKLTGADNATGRLAGIKAQIAKDRAQSIRMQGFLSEAEALPASTISRDTAIREAKGKLARLRELIAEGEDKAASIERTAADEVRKMSDLRTGIASMERKRAELQNRIGQSESEIAVKNLKGRTGYMKKEDGTPLTGTSSAKGADDKSRK